MQYESATCEFCEPAGTQRANHSAKTRDEAAAGDSVQMGSTEDFERRMRRQFYEPRWTSGLVVSTCIFVGASWHMHRDAVPLLLDWGEKR